MNHASVGVHRRYRWSGNRPLDLTGRQIVRRATSATVALPFQIYLTTAALRFAVHQFDWFFWGAYVGSSLLH